MQRAAAAGVVVHYVQIHLRPAMRVTDRQARMTGARPHLNAAPVQLAHHDLELMARLRGVRGHAGLRCAKGAR